MILVFFITLLYAFVILLRLLSICYVILFCYFVKLVILELLIKL